MPGEEVIGRDSFDGRPAFPGARRYGLPVDRLVALTDEHLQAVLDTVDRSDGVVPLAETRRRRECRNAGEVGLVGRREQGDCRTEAVAKQVDVIVATARPVDRVPGVNLFGASLVPGAVLDAKAVDPARLQGLTHPPETRIALISPPVADVVGRQRRMR